ncbi:U11/U12 small nuclear ribonucleoprotein 48 kDa protein-like [Hetaerina americana]|uniref:U11/U12 small nuclear ribonucleoprotein 48 kDa protein-like n=1 Tax=Hetaerina americana TaxID=62018 RepID=UPI003A7F217C
MTSLSDMNIDLEKRKAQLKILNRYISDARGIVFDVTKQLQWDVKSLDQKQEMVCCPFDDGHVVPKSSLQRHVECCKLSKQCYHPEDIPFPPVPVDLNASSVLKVDKDLQVSILRQAKEKNPAMLIGFPGAVDDRDVAMTSDRFMSSLTSDERSAIHSYVISKTVSPNEGKDISLLEQDLEKNFKNKKEETRDKTPLERLIEERDAKRRKEGKKVHINRKSHTEIIREVIENQMEVYVEWLKDEKIIKREEAEPAQLVESDNHSEGEIIEPPIKQECISGSGFSDNMKSFDWNERQRKPRDSSDRKRSYQRRELYESSDGWRQSDQHKFQESHSRSHHSRDSGSKNYWDSESTSCRESERRNYKEHDYKKFSSKYSADEKGSSQGMKHSSEKYWDGGTHVVKEHASSGEEVETESKGRKRRREKTDSGKKQEREKRHHKSRRRHHSIESDGDDRTKYCKEKDRRRYK